MGRYIPEFEIFGADGRPEAAESGAAPVAAERPIPPDRRSILAQLDDIILIVLLTAVALALALIGSQILAPRATRLDVPEPPMVSVAEFTSVAAADSPSVSVAGLAVELVTDHEDHLRRTGQPQNPSVEIGRLRRGNHPFKIAGKSEPFGGCFHFRLRAFGHDKK